MGRYYSGDIEGKFWFAVQDSNDADFFGVVGDEITNLQYYFSTKDLKKVNAGVKKCLTELSKYKKQMDVFFEKNNVYNDEMLRKFLDITMVKTKKLLVWYARLGLGEKIQKCLKESGSCCFDAEI